MKKPTPRRARSAPAPAPAPAPADQSVLTLEADAAHADELAAWLEARFGKSPVQLQRPDSNRVWIELYFDTDAEAVRASRASAGQPGVLGAGTRLCRARDWQSFWRHHFHAHDVGTRLRICPTWEARRDRAPGRVRLLLDPGLSFGTGEHFTTRFCLEMLDTLCQKSRPLSMLDVGTGSGILAMAAAKLGVRRVLGTDNDAQALEQARRNLALNRLSRRIRLAVMDITTAPPPGRFDLVCANIYARILIEVAPALVRCAQKHLVLSGIREHELDGVAETYLELGLREIGRDGDGQWGGLVLECRTRSSST